MPNTLTDLYAIFHLNLAYSSIDEDQYDEVIERCYWPLLHMCQDYAIPVGIEATAFTLREIQKRSPEWINTFDMLLKDKRCELLASGECQIIGPLVPAKMNEINLELGLDEYRRLFNITPHIAYINEQAVSTGLLNIYKKYDFKAVVIEWDNPFSYINGWSEDTLKSPQLIKTAKGSAIPTLWNHAVTFQKLQRYVHGEIPLTEYMNYLKHRCEGAKCFPVYGNDVEVFDFRPSRYHTEATKNDGEWQKIAEAFVALGKEKKFQWKLPSQCLDHLEAKKPLDFSNAQHPILVKKQSKYNVTRWGLSGRNDLYLNTICHQKLRALETKLSVTVEEKRALCTLWSSDYRTHLTETRHKAIEAVLPTYKPTQLNRTTSKRPLDNSVTIKEDTEHHLVTIATPEISLTLSRYRGLAIRSLGFKQHDFTPVCGTLPHGHFSHISLAADFYSNHLVVEDFKQQRRIADLNRCDYEINQTDEGLEISSTISTPLGNVVKTYVIEGEKLHCKFNFEHNTRPESSFRLGFITLMDTTQRAWFACKNGGETTEGFLITEDTDHGAPVSSIISSTTALGATDGKLYFGSGDLGLKLSWDPASCAALPMISSKEYFGQVLNRAWFSLVESDETLRAGGTLPNFSYSIAPCGKHKSVVV